MKEIVYQRTFYINLRILNMSLRLPVSIGIQWTLPSNCWEPWQLLSLPQWEWGQPWWSSGMQLIYNVISQICYPCANSTLTYIMAVDKTIGDMKVAFLDFRIPWVTIWPLWSFSATGHLCISFDNPPPVQCNRNLHDILLLPQFPLSFFYFSQVLSPMEDHGSRKISKSVQEGSKRGKQKNSESPHRAPSGKEINRPSESCIFAQTKSARTHSYKRTLSSNLQSTRTSLPKKEILQRIKSKKDVSSYQLGHQLSLKWSTGAGPRIGCVADYPLKLRLQTLEFVNLSPRDLPTPSVSNLHSILTSISTLCVVMWPSIDCLS